MNYSEDDDFVDCMDPECSVCGDTGEVDGKTCLYCQPGCPVCHDSNEHCDVCCG